VQKVREAAARMQCQNNLKQIAIAVHAYHDAKGGMPPGRDSKNFSTQTYILPFIEQGNLFNQIDFTISCSITSNQGSNTGPMATPIKTYRCPSDPNSSPAQWAPSNYRMNQGTSISWGNVTTPTVQIPAINGPFFLNSATKITDISDGTSQTAMASEAGLGSFNSAQVDPNNTQYLGSAVGLYPADTDSANIMCTQVGWQQAQYNNYPNTGAPWMYGYHSTTIYFHTILPNGTSCMYPSNRITTTARSRHTNGVNLALCDGSVRFATNSIPLAAWRALGTMNQGDIVQE
jgi:prepilin-type processing-associated H-X9-DG protein